MHAPLNTLIAAVASARLLPLRLVLGVLLMLGVVFPAVWSRHPARRAAAYRILALLTETSNARTPPSPQSHQQPSHRDVANDNLTTGDLRRRQIC